jgi:hypothetical protein
MNWEDLEGSSHGLIKVMLVETMNLNRKSVKSFAHDVAETTNNMY